MEGQFTPEAEVEDQSTLEALLVYDLGFISTLLPIKYVSIKLLVGYEPVIFCMLVDNINENSYIG